MDYGMSLLFVVFKIDVTGILLKALKVTALQESYSL